MGVYKLSYKNNIEKLFFVTLGTFITSSYTRDFTLFDILRKPLNFPIVRKGDMFVTKIPKGFPWQETILLLGNDFVTKTKDVPVRKGLQKSDDNSDLFLIDGSELRTKVFGWNDGEMNSGMLSYSPIYRFFTEPFFFNMHDDICRYLSKAVSYMLRREGVNIEVGDQVAGKYEILVEDKKFPFAKFVFSGSESFDLLEVIGSDQVSSIDLSARRLFIAKEHSPVCFMALSKTGERSLKNIFLNKAGERIEVNYEG